MQTHENINKTIETIRANVRDRDSEVSRTLYNVYYNSIGAIIATGTIINLVLSVIIGLICINLAERPNMQDKSLIPLGTMLVVSSKDVAKLKQ